MKRLSSELLAKTVLSRRKEQKLSQQNLSKKTGINRALISRIESCSFVPSVEQLENLAEALNFDLTELFVDESTHTRPAIGHKYRIAVAGTGYVGLSIQISYPG